METTQKPATRDLTAMQTTGGLDEMGRYRNAPFEWSARRRVELGSLLMPTVFHCRFSDSATSIALFG